MELLAPAGGMEQLQAAVMFGADAVYLASDRFGMRARATNFSLEDIPCAVQVSHEAGVKVHVTANVLMHPQDMRELPAYFEALDAAGVDAFIIGDLGAAALARQYAPRVALHVSTQASVANAQAARVWHEAVGASRVVCAREMSLDDIALMRADMPRSMELEVFAHGAMCMAVSGRCLISSYLTGRSGNKGHCTQPCRWNYTLEEEKRPGVHFPVEEDDRGTFIMNAKDLNMLAHLDALRAAGVDSIKIEGRNKKAFYVATVVNAYRRVMDGEDPALVASELDTMSHRPYSTGFYFGPAEQACDYDGYEQTCLHVADVTGCDSAVRLQVTDCDPVVRLSGGGDPKGLSACTEPQAESAAGQPDCPPHSDFAAGSDAGAWCVHARCRNRFAEGDELEVLEPGGTGRTVVVRNLTWLPDPGEADPHPAPQPVAVANRSCGHYCFEASEPLRPGSFLRVRQFRRSSRS